MTVNNNNKTWQFVINDFFDQYYIIDKKDVIPLYAQYTISNYEKKMLMTHSDDAVNDLIKIQLAQTLAKMILERFELSIEENDNNTVYNININVIEDISNWLEKNKRNL